MKQNFNKWFADKGDETLRLDYPLTKDSVVFDVGGYKGDWAAKISEKYGCKVIVFEPVKSYYNALLERFKGNYCVDVINFALGSKNEDVEILINNDASSFFTKNGEKEIVKVCDVADYLKDFVKIDLMKINIEGSEYSLLERMIEKNLHHNITDIQVQFHTFISDFEQRYNAIKNELLKTHYQTFCYDFIWENWRKND